jgi:hypothetical protein
MAATYYISAAGNDANSGTSPALAWATLAKVNSSSFGAGDSILFEGGSTFSGSISFDSATSGTPERPIIISSWGEGQAIISSGDATGLKIYNTAGFTITDLIFRGSGRTQNKGSGIDFYMDLPTERLAHILIERVEVEGYYFFGILIGSWNGSGGYDDVTIKDALVHDNGQGGIFTYAKAVLAHRNIYIAHTKAYNNSGLPNRTDHHTGSGIIVSGADGALVEYCEAYNNGWLNAWNGGGPVGIWGYSSNKLVIQYSESHHNKSGTAKDGGGFDIDGGCTNCTLQYNYAHNNEGPGYLIAQYPEAPEMKGVVIRFNISENDARGGNHGAIHLWSAGSNGGIQGADIYNNTIYVSPSENATPKAVYVQSGGVHQASFRNNIIYTQGEVPLLVADTTANMRFEGNNYWVGEGNFIIRWGATTFASLEAWRDATAQEVIDGKATGYFVKPRLKSAGRGKTLSEPGERYTLESYQLKDRSPLRGAGLDLKRLFNMEIGKSDFWGNLLPAQLSIGAHQPPVY